MREHTIKLMLERERLWKQQVEPSQLIDPAVPQELPIMQLSHVLIGTIVWRARNAYRCNPYGYYSRA